MKNKFEAVFNEFVTEFGGEMLTEPSDTKIADYVFRKQNIVAELKCLMEDQTSAMNKKVTRVVQEWLKKHKKLPPGYDGEPLEIAKAPKEIADRWLEILKAPIENSIRDANRQIRETKRRESLTQSADGRVATVATRLGRNTVPKRSPLTPTGLLMEGDYTNYDPWPVRQRADSLQYSKQGKR